MARVLLAKARRVTFEQTSLVPPLGVMSLASYLRSAGHDVRILDMRHGETDTARFQALLSSFQPQVVGLSAITFEASILRDLAAAARATLPHVPIVVGGAHATAYPERCLDSAAINHVVVGEGEESFLELVEALTRGGREPASIPGVVTRGADGQVVRAPARTTTIDLDTLPFPAWDLIDVESYASLKGMAPIGRRRYLPISTSRGCPYRCIYCHSVHGKRYRTRSAENVLAEVREIHERYGIDELEVYDDTFNLDRGRALAILEGLARLPWRPTLSFPNGLRTDLLDRELIQALRAAGTVYLSVAVESASPRIQKLIGKHLDLARVRENIAFAAREGIFVNGFFMFGFPTETLAEARETLRFALESDLHSALFFTVTPYAGTELYERWRDLIHERAGELDIEQHDYYDNRYNLSDMSDAELLAIHREAWRRFFLSPRRALRIVLRYPRPLYLVTESLRLIRKMIPRPTRAR